MQEVKLGWDPGHCLVLLSPSANLLAERAEVTDSCQGCLGPTALPKEVEVGGSGPVVGLGGHLCAIWVWAQH